MNSKNILDSVISIIFLVILGLFMYHTRGMVQKESNDSKKELILSSNDSLIEYTSGSDFHLSNSQKIKTFK